MGVLRQPLLHFVLLGALLFGAQRLIAPDSAGATRIEVSAAQVQRLHSDWLRQMARPPTAQELRAAVDRLADEEVLLAEALRLELDARDPVASERLLRNMRFAFPDAREDDAGLLRAARELGMSQRDLVVRRRLIQVMRHRLVSEAAISEAEVRAHAAANPGDYARPARWSFEQVLLSRDLARPDIGKEAQALLASLRDGTIAAERAGDPFMLGRRFDALAEGDIAARFGKSFAQTVAEAPVGSWIGPVESAYGLHLLRVATAEPGTQAEYHHVRARAAYDLRSAREAELLREAVARLRQRYEVRVETGTLAGAQS